MSDGIACESVMSVHEILPTDSLIFLVIKLAILFLLAPDCMDF